MICSLLFFLFDVVEIRKNIGLDSRVYTRGISEAQLWFHWDYIEVTVVLGLIP